MSAQNTDKFRKVAPNTGWQVGAAGIIDDVVDNFTLVSTTGFPSDTAVLVTVDRVDQNGVKTPSKMERIVGVVSGNNLINCIRGKAGTAQPHSPGAVVEIVISASSINDLIDGILAEHNQLGGHTVVSLEDQTAVPSKPAAGTHSLYFKDDGNLYQQDEDGNEKVAGKSVISNSIASSDTPSVNVDTTDEFTITALKEAITSFTTNLSGTPVNGQKLIIRIKDDGTARAITWGDSFVSIGADLPTTTTAGKYMYVGLIYNSTEAVWDCVAVVEES